MTVDLRAATVSRDDVNRIFQHLQDVLLVLDANGVIETVNEAASRMLQYRKEQLIGQHINSVFPNKDSWTVDWILSQASISDFEEVCLTSEKEPIPVEISVSAIVDDDARTHRTIMIMRDLTDLKEAERERQRLLDQLHRSQRMEAIGTLAAGVAHDLNNILSGLTSYPEILLMDLPEGSSMHAPLITIKKSGEKAARIVKDMLTLARRGVRINKAVELNAVIRDYVESHEHKQILRYHNGVAVTLKLETHSHFVMGSTSQLSKMINNLVSNAAEALPDGGTILIGTQKVQLDRELSVYETIPAGDYTCLTVSDTGIGISPDDLARIFEPFFTKKHMGRSGTGLGMAIVWGTVKDHNGFVNVQSTEGEGTTFNIYLPITQKPVEPSTARSLTTYSGHGEKVLVVDDVEEQRIIAEKMLRRLNYDVDTVDCGLAAVNYVKQQVPDLIILDMIMDPGIDGLETYKRIAALRPDQKVVVASGYSETERVEALLKLSGGVCIKKPYSLEEMGMAVQQTLHACTLP